MKFGLFFSFANPEPWQVPAPRLCESLIRQTVLAEELGFDHVWTGGHHGTDEYYPAQFPLLAAMAVKTSRIRIGTYIVILPLHNPLQVTEEAVTLDVLSDGRFELGLGVGNFVDDFKAYRISRRERGARMEEGLTIVKGLWEQNSFAFEGRFYSVPPFPVRPRPVQERAPLWVAATVDPAFKRAARFGAHLAGTAHGYDIYDGYLSEYGYDPAAFNKGMLMFMHLAPTRARAWAEAAPFVHHFLTYYDAQFSAHEDFIELKKLMGSWFGVDPIPPVEKLHEAARIHFLNSPFIIGTPRDAIEELERIQEMGVTHPVIEMQIEGMDPRLTEHSMRLFASRVMPQFR
jgi:alkanesulfonate monooxygenase SsuD/methylene tetrahydromethanopterin reductase-like flavin-dependent oxidoreductase (luciferase family)